MTRLEDLNVKRIDVEYINTNALMGKAKNIADVLRLNDTILVQEEEHKMYREDFLNSLLQAILKKENVYDDVLETCKCGEGLYTTYDIVSYILDTNDDTSCPASNIWKLMDASKFPMYMIQRTITGTSVALAAVEDNLSELTDEYIQNYLTPESCKYIADMVYLVIVEMKAYKIASHHIGECCAGA